MGRGLQGIDEKDAAEVTIRRPGVLEKPGERQRQYRGCPTFKGASTKKQTEGGKKP